MDRFLKNSLSSAHKFLNDSLVSSVRFSDAVIASLFVILITLQPYFLHGTLNYFELGIYLPGIGSLLAGEVPYRDFFHLRGPVELYIPALLMKIFGPQVNILHFYFYVGTVFTLIICVFLAKEILRSRLVFYVLVPVLVARTFPRVVFHIWGGLRYGIGLLAILWAIYYFKRQKKFWIILSGVSTGLAFLISVEIGICSLLSVLGVMAYMAFLKLQKRSSIVRAAVFFLLGIIMIVLPYVVYLSATRSLGPYLDCTFSVATNMTKVFPDYYYEEHPKNFVEVVKAMNVFNKHFKHLTPAYCYMALFGYWLWAMRKRVSVYKNAAFIVLAFYGGLMYILAFRKIGAGQFEMALQPEKILFFFMIEAVLLFMWSRKDSIVRWRFLPLSKALREGVVYFLVVAFIGSSIGYSITRYNKRFFAFQYLCNLFSGRSVEELMPIERKDSYGLLMPRARGIIVEPWQAQGINELYDFTQKNTVPNEKIFMFPELGVYNFLVERRFVGKFPVVTFSWMNERWHKELMAELSQNPPRYAVVMKKLDPTFEKAYFKVPRNKEMFDDIYRYLLGRYALSQETSLFLIYHRKDDRI